MSQTQTLKFSKVDFCPACRRKLCKRSEVDGVSIIEFRHKGAQIVAQELTVTCIGCAKKFVITAQAGIIDEVE